jgi:ubiquinone biosynthesis protein
MLLLPARLVWLTVLTAACALTFVAASLLARRRRPALVRWYFQTAGGFFVKVGQILAHRYDLLPVEYCDALSRLFDRLPAYPTEGIIRVIESSLGRPIGECFLDFDERPLSCASVAQVHAARAPSGDPVVVKVVRPGSEARFSIDLLFVRAISAALDFVGLGARLGVARLARELQRATQEEFDLSRELRNAQELATRLNESAPDHSVPKLYPELSSRAVLTMERVDGVPVIDLIAALDRNDTALLSRWAARGIEPERVARLVLESMLVQIIQHRVFHADPHAANLFVRVGGGLTFIDFGLIGHLDEEQWVVQWRLRAALASRRVHAAYEALASGFETSDGGPPPEDFEQSVKATLFDWISASENEKASVVNKSAGKLLLAVLTTARRHDLRLPAGLVRLYKALIVSDMVVLKLHPGIDILGVVSGVISEQRRRQLEALTKEALAVPAGRDRDAVQNLAAALPEFLAGLQTYLDVRDGVPARRSAQPRPSVARHLGRALLTHAQVFVLAFAAAALAQRYVGPFPWLERVFQALPFDVRGNELPTSAIAAGVLVYLRRMQLKLFR